MMARLRHLLLLLSLFLCLEAGLTAADRWIEVKSEHFTVVSNDGERSTRRLVWQLEQVRSALAALWQWARVDLNKPLLVIAVKDEPSMRAVAPQFWEDRRSVRPSSVWITGPDQHYLAIRTDLQAEAQGHINPHVNAYFSYIGLVMDQSLSRNLPLWFRRGFTGVLSNTIVLDDSILVGAPIPWHLERLRESASLSLAKLVTVTRSSPEFTQAGRMEVFDAQTWAFVHFLMFADKRARVEALNTYAQLVSKGKEAASAFQEALGPVEALEGPFRVYISRSIFGYSKVNVDVGIERERIPARVMMPAEAASALALFHAAMRRPKEARTAIAAARKADPNLAEGYAAEGLLLDSEEKTDEARAVFAKAVELGTTSAYVHYRLASLMWRPAPDRAALVEIEQLLGRAIQLNNRFAAAYAWAGEVRASLGTDGLPLIRRAISLEPAEARHRLRAARVLLRQGKPDEARLDAQAALMLAGDDDERRDSQELLDAIAKKRSGDP